MALVRINEQGRRIGETHRNARHSDADVERAIAAYEVLQSYAKVAAAMGAKKSTVRDVRTHRTWREYGGMFTALLAPRKAA